MRFFPEPSRLGLPSTSIPVGVTLALVGALMLDTSGGATATATAAREAVPTSSPALANPTRMTSAAPAPAASAPSARGVAPKVQTTEVGRVVARTQAETARGLHVTAPRSTRLFAHVERRQLPRFSLLGVTWQHADVAANAVAVRVRTRTTAGWGQWQALAADADGPSAAEDSRERDGTEALWVNRASGVDVAVFARPGAAPRGIQVSTIDPGSTGYDAALPQLAPAPTAAQARADDGTFPAMPKIVTRRQWGADESLGDECWDPKYGTTFKAVIVHHTAGSNDYAKRDAAAVVRGVYAYHVLSRGWCDIGYNFLIDRYGTIYEGRDGGIRRPVRGAHAGDYNVDTTGISMMGNFDVTKPRGPMKRSLVALVAWRLGTAYHNARGRPFLYDGRFDRISGHRDVMSTDCPGRYVYAWLPALRHRMDRRLGDYASNIEQKWRRHGGASGSGLGPVSIGEQVEDGGRHTSFRHGRMYASKAGLITLMTGAILHRYREARGVDGFLGYPTSGVWPTHTRRAGTGANFAGGTIYWSGPTGVRLIRAGAILSRYLAERGPRGRLGFPVGEVRPTSAGAKAGFEHGVIRYSRATGKTTVTLR